MTRNQSTWINGKRKVTGTWQYNWPSDSFTIFLDQRDRVTGENKVIVTTNDTPEWGNWKRIKDKSENTGNLANLVTL